MPCVDLDAAVWAVDTAEGTGLLVKHLCQCWWNGSPLPAVVQPGSRSGCWRGRVARTVNSLWGVGECSCGFLPGDLWEQESGINGFAEGFAVGTVLDRWCRPCDNPELWGHKSWGHAAPLGSLCLQALSPALFLAGLCQGEKLEVKGRAQSC